MSSVITNVMPPTNLVLAHDQKTGAILLEPLGVCASSRDAQCLAHSTRSDAVSCSRFAVTFGILHDASHLADGGGV